MDGGMGQDEMEGRIGWGRGTINGEEWMGGMGWDGVDRWTGWDGWME